MYNTGRKWGRMKEGMRKGRGLSFLHWTESGANFTKFWIRCRAAYKRDVSPLTPCLVSVSCHCYSPFPYYRIQPGHQLALPYISGGSKQSK